MQPADYRDRNFRRAVQDDFLRIRRGLARKERAAFQKVFGSPDYGRLVARPQRSVGVGDDKLPAALDVPDFHAPELQRAQGDSDRLGVGRNLYLLQFNRAPREVLESHSLGIADALGKLDGGQRLGIYQNVDVEVPLVVHERGIDVDLVVDSGDCGFRAQLCGERARHDVELVVGGHSREEIAIGDPRPDKARGGRAVAAHHAHVQTLLDFVGGSVLRFDEGDGVPVLAENLAKVVPDIARSCYYYFHILRILKENAPTKANKYARAQIPPFGRDFASRGTLLYIDIFL